MVQLWVVGPGKSSWKTARRNDRHLPKLSVDVRCYPSVGRTTRSTEATRSAWKSIASCSTLTGWTMERRNRLDHLWPDRWDRAASPGTPDAFSGRTWWPASGRRGRTRGSRPDSTPTAIPADLKADWKTQISASIIAGLDDWLDREYPTVGCTSLRCTTSRNRSKSHSWWLPWPCRAGTAFGNSLH